MSIYVLGQKVPRIGIKKVSGRVRLALKDLRVR